MNSILEYIATGLLLFILAFVSGMGVGFNQAKTVIQKDCDLIGKLRVDEVVYNCEKFKR